MNLEIESSELDEQTVTFTVSGEVDVFTSTGLKDAVESALNQGQTRIVMLLSGVEYIDSTGLGVLINALKLAHDKGGSLILIAPSHRVVRLFDLTGVTSLFTIFETIEAANLSEAIPAK